MDNIFTGLYNKVLGFFRQTDSEKEDTAKDVACNRLRFVLMQDRTNLTPELMERMRKEMVELLSKYVEMDKDALELNLAHDGDQVALMLSIPVVRAKDEDEINAALEEADAKETEDDSEIAEDSKIDEIEAEDENLKEDEAAEESETKEELDNEDLNAEEDEAAEEELSEPTETNSETKKSNKSK